MKIAILGASVSAQTVKHDTGEVSGYVEVLRRDFKDRIGASDIVQFTYAGNRASDAGLVRVLDVLAYKADICIFEPLVEDTNRGASAKIEEIMFIYRSLINAKILPVTLFLPLPWLRVPNHWPLYRVYRKICDDFELPAVEVDLNGVADLEQKFVGVHTTESGGRIYADAIARKIGSLRGIEHLTATAAARFQRVALTVFHDRLATPSQDKLQFVNLEVQPFPPAKGWLKIIQHQMIGPFSPLLTAETRVASDDAASSTIETRSVWDPYCHYNRLSYVALYAADVAGPQPQEVSIRVSAEDPQYSTSRRVLPNWPTPETRHMKPRGDIFVFSSMPARARLLRYE